MKNFVMVMAMLFSFATYSQPQKSLLWKVSGNGLKESSYLFGTIHITCDATLDEKTLDAMKQTKQLYLELNMEDPALQREMMAGMMMKDGMTLKSIMSEEDYTIIDQYMLKELGFSASALNSVKPFLVSAMFFPSMLSCPIQNVEQELIKISKEQQEKVFGLETVAEQMAVFDAIPYKVQAEELLISIKDDFKNDKAELVKLLATYKSSDLDAILLLMNESENKITSNHKELLLTNRNVAWIPKIEKIVREVPTFFGVGASHLAGEDGLIALLRKQGFTVAPVF